MILRALTAAFLLATSPIAASAFAHPGHEHEEAPPELDEQGAKDRATKEVARLITKKKVEESWKDASVKGVEKRPLKKGWEWLVTFENPAGTKGKVLFVFLKPTGKFVAANFTGK